MEQLKNRISGLKPDVALWIYCGIPALLLIMFLCVDQVGSNADESLSLNGLQMMFGKSTVELGRHSMDAVNKTGFGAVYALIYIVGLIGAAVMGYTKQIANYKLAVIPVVVLFLMLSFGVNLIIEDSRFQLRVVLPGTPIAWFEFLLGLAWCVFAYMRGNERIVMK